MKVENYIQKIDLLNLLEKLGIKNLRELNNDIMGCCPFHKESRPSWGINKKTGVWNCFSCEGKNSRGNLITLVAQIKKISFKRAINYLYSFAGITRDFIVNNDDIKNQVKNIVRGKKNYSKESPQEFIVSLPKNMRDDFYHGIRYFHNRGINTQTLRRHNISFCVNGYYRNRAIIPIYDASKKLILFEARDITGVSDDKVLYPKGGRKSDTLYNIENAKNQGGVIMVEGIMDALYLEERGYNVVAPFGIKISPQQEQILSRYFRKVYLCFDGDKQGYSAMLKQAKELSLYLIVHIIILPKGKDPDQLSCEEFDRLRKNSIEINEYLSQRIFRKFKNT